jgi:hypothetical protein
LESVALQSPIRSRFAVVRTVYAAYPDRERFLIVYALGDWPGISGTLEFQQCVDTNYLIRKGFSIR